MGTSTNAVLFYGHCWTEETTRPWCIGRDSDDDEEEDWEERYAAALGVTRPETPYPDRRAANGYSTPTDYTPEEQAAINEHKAYWDQKSKLTKRSGCEVDFHCSGDYPMPLVAISKSMLTSHRGDKTEVKGLDVNPEWDDMLAEFCKVLGIKTKAKPRWWLVSYWG